MIGPTRTSVGGRGALVTYLDSEFSPVEEAEATLAKVVFDDGQTLFLVPKAPVAKYSDDQPR